MPPVLPIPMVADGTDGDAQFCSNFLNGLYDTCESKPKPRGKLGDTQWNQWEPSGQLEDEGILSTIF